MRAKCLILVLVLSLSAGCSREFKGESIRFGSDLTKTGLIAKPLAEYSFSYAKGGTMKDLCNFIYFEGDTVCFSADFSGTVDGDVAVWFVDPLSGRRIMAERVERLRSRVYGFSLVGSLCEFLYKGSLDAPVTPEGNRRLSRPFTVIVEAAGKGRKSLIEGRGELTVRY